MVKLLEGRDTAPGHHKQLMLLITLREEKVLQFVKLEKREKNLQHTRETNEKSRQIFKLSLQ